MNTANRYVLDAWAWFAYFNGGKDGIRVKEKIETCEVFTSAANLAEVISGASRRGVDTEKAFEAMVSLSKIVAMDAISGRDIGLLHSGTKKTRKNFSFGDASALQTARSLGAVVLTGDPDFKGLKDVEMLV